MYGFPDISSGSAFLLAHFSPVALKQDSMKQTTEMEEG